LLICGRCPRRNDERWRIALALGPLGPWALALSCRGNSHGCRSDDSRGITGDHAAHCLGLRPVSLSLPRSNSPIRKKDRLDKKLRTDCSLRPSLAPVRLKACCDWASRGQTEDAVIVIGESIIFDGIVC